jgi:hypothetical protein
MYSDATTQRMAGGSHDEDVIMELSNRELLSRLQSLASEEHAATVEILLHLNEVERRRLHLTLGYGTMFDFATRHLRYSASAAGRRIQVARCIARHPDLLGPLRVREINLSTIALIAGILDDGNVKELLDAIRGKSHRDVERIVATYRPGVEVRDRVRPVRVNAAASPGRGGDATSLFAEAAVRSVDGVTNGYQDAGRIPSGVSHSRRREWNARGARRDGDGVAPPTGAAATETVTEPQFKIQFAAGSDFVRKLEEARAILSSRSSKGVSLGQVLETALDAFLDRKSPLRRKARRERSGARRNAAPAAAPRPARRTDAAAAARLLDRDVGARAGEAPRSGRADRSRHIPVAVRDAVFARDGGRCTYVGEHGAACESRHNLHVDHVEPFARGGPPTPGNLRLLCAAHNQVEAERAYGSQWMRRFRGGGDDSS